MTNLKAVAAIGLCAASGCVALEIAYELTCSFEKDYRLGNFHMTVALDEEVPFISSTER